jgi:ribonuclease E
MNEKRSEVNNINEKNKVTIIIIPNANLESPKYKLTRYRSDNDETESISSHELIEKNINPAHEFDEDKKIQSEEPTVKGIKPDKPIPIKKSNSMLSFIYSLKNIIFSNTEKIEPQRKKTKNYNPNYKGKKFNKNYKHRNNKFSKGKNYNKKD